MKRNLSVMVAATVISLVPVSVALADTIDRSTHERVNTPRPQGLPALLGQEPSGANEVPAQQTQSVVGGSTLNIKQPVAEIVPEMAAPAPEVQPQQVAQPPAVQQAQPQPAPAPVKSVKRTRAGNKASGVSEARWWEKDGNPKVFAFRDCISGFARTQAQSAPKVNLRSVVAKAIKSDCDGSFSDMSRVLSSRFGSEKSREFAKELTESTFVPAVREAVLKVRDEQKIAAAKPSPLPAAAPPVPPASPASVPSASAATVPLPVSGEVELELAKEEMFSCYRDAADRVGPQPNREIDAVVDEVLLDCSDNTRSFFRQLFAIYPHSPASQADRMRDAISTNYRPAIARRVTALRAAGVSVPKQKVTSTAQ